MISRFFYTQNSKENIKDTILCLTFNKIRIKSITFFPSNFYFYKCISKPYAFLCKLLSVFLKIRCFLLSKPSLNLVKTPIKFSKFFLKISLKSFIKIPKN